MQPLVIDGRAFALPGLVARVLGQYASYEGLIIVVQRHGPR